MDTSLVTGPGWDLVHCLMVSPVPGKRFCRSCKLCSSCGQMWGQQRQGLQQELCGCGCTRAPVHKGPVSLLLQLDQRMEPTTRSKNDKTSSLFDKSPTPPAGLGSCHVPPIRTPRKQPGITTSRDAGCHTWPSATQKVSSLNILQEW